MTSDNTVTPCPYYYGTPKNHDDNYHGYEKQCNKSDGYTKADPDSCEDPEPLHVDRLQRIKRFLFQIRECHRRMDILRNRINLREGLPADDLYIDIEELRRKLGKAEQDTRILTVRVTDLIGNLDDVNQQMILIKRYVEMKPWDAIGAEMDMPPRTIQKLHGKALDFLQNLLDKDGSRNGGAA